MKFSKTLFILLAASLALAACESHVAEIHTTGRDQFVMTHDQVEGVPAAAESFCRQMHQHAQEVSRKGDTVTFKCVY